MDADTRITVHEAVCAERYANIELRLGRTERLMMTAIGGIILQLIALVGFFASKVI
jgi:hypothetical protein